MLSTNSHNSLSISAFAQLIIFQILTLSTNFVSLANAGMCPQLNHTVCNADHPYHACVCAMSLKEEAPPEKSCNKLLKIERNKFPAASVIFHLDATAEHHDVFPEEKFREVVSSSLRIDPDDLIILRVRCMDDNERLTVQFVILKDKKKKNVKITKSKIKKKPFKETVEEDEEEDDDEENEDEFVDEEEEEEEERENDDGTMEIEYEDDGNEYVDESVQKKSKKKKKAQRKRKNETPRIYHNRDMIRASEIVYRMKTISHFSQLADIDVEKIEVVRQMVDIEGDPTNVLLVVQAVLSGIAFAMMCILGVWKGFQKRDSDEQQYESVEQKA